eukprot:2384528-Pyramimonas_sp.AAC.1
MLPRGSVSPLRPASPGAAACRAPRIVELTDRPSSGLCPSLLPSSEEAPVIEVEPCWPCSRGPVLVQKGYVEQQRRRVQQQRLV